MKTKFLSMSMSLKPLLDPFEIWGGLTSYKSSEI